MKKQFILLTASLLITTSAIFAQENKAVPAAVSNEIQKDFKNVIGLNWKAVDQFYKASFVVDGVLLEAFYTTDGKKTAVARKLTVDQLPMVLSKEVKEKATTHTITDLFELLTEKGTEYFMSIKNEKETKTFRSEGSSWTRY